MESAAKTFDTASAAETVLLAACRDALAKLEALRETVGWLEDSRPGGADAPVLTLDAPYVEPAIQALRTAIAAAESR